MNLCTKARYYKRRAFVLTVSTISQSPAQHNQLLLCTMQYTLKKSLGQHFLKDENICRNMAEIIQQSLTAARVTHLTEVGPGAGALIKYLLQMPGIDLKAIELDKEKVDFLRLKYPGIRDKIIHEDFLQTDPPFEGEFILAGNFPYNISTQIVFKVLDWKEQVPEMIGMFQKEVAQRIASQPGSKVYGILSVLVQAYYTVEYLFDVPPESFMPPPKVMSGVIKISRKPVPVTLKSDRSFFVLVKTAFNQRRKMLRNAVKNLFNEEILKDDIFNKRAEQLSIEDFAALTFRMR